MLGARADPPPHSNRAFSLLSLATSYILRHFDAIVETPGWIQLPRALVAALLTSSDLITVSEARVVQAAVRWALAAAPVGSQSDIFTASATADATLALTLSALPKVTPLPLAAAAEAARSAEAYLAALLAGSTGGPLLPDITLPPLPTSVLPAVRALVAQLAPSFRLARLSLPILRSGVLAAVVTADRLLSAVFEKLAGEDAQAAAAAEGDLEPPLVFLDDCGGGGGRGGRSGGGSTSGFSGSGSGSSTPRIFAFIKRGTGILEAECLAHTRRYP